MLTFLKHQLYSLKNSDNFIKHLRQQGVSIGQGCVFRKPRSISIDLTRPCLVSFGNYVDVNHGFTVLTHDYATTVFLRKYGEFISSTGGVKIGNNIFIGRNVMILKGVQIGDNSVIGAGSLVTKTIPENSVACGNPAKVISSIDDYLMNRKRKQLGEAVEFYHSIKKSLNRTPTIGDFHYEFSLFIDKRNVENKACILAERKLKEHYNTWYDNHKSRFDGFEEFKDYAESHPPR